MIYTLMGCVQHVHVSRFGREDGLEVSTLGRKDRLRQVISLRLRASRLVRTCERSYRWLSMKLLLQSRTMGEPGEPEGEPFGSRATARACGLSRDSASMSPPTRITFAEPRRTLIEVAS